MVQILEQTKDNIVATKATGTLTKDDYDEMLPVLRNKLEEHKKIKWYFEMENFEGWKPAAAWKDFKFDVKNASNLQKVAMVGAKEWEEGLTQIMKPFTSAEVRFFETNQKEEAKNWIEH